MAQPKRTGEATGTSRRDFMKTSAVAAGAALASVPVFSVQAQETKRSFKAVLIGCGGRGNGAAANHLEAVKYLNDKLGWQLDVEFIATADWFQGRAEGAGKRYGVPTERCFSGGDCYKKALEVGPDIVVMAQPPVFRPLHFEAAIKAGKHVFFEKPSAVDPPGVRRVIEAGELAKQKGLCVVAGTQRRHSEGYNRKAMEIKEGAYGRVMAGRVAWNMGRIFTNTPVNPTGPDQLVGPWQIWVEMSGDHICEQHVHNLDIANWYLDSHPISAGGFGFRARRVAGNMYDFFSIDLEYPGGAHVHSMCRQVADCWDWVGEDFTYEKSKPGDFKLEAADPYGDAGYHPNAYVAEHAHLLYAIVKGQQLNEARNVAWATGAAVLGRESAYSGKRITWAEMFDDPAKNPAVYNLQLRPTAEDFETGEIKLLKDGDIRIPGV
ncbi:MAG: Gfo/Idh/MocA family oxidoreductase [Pirellulales bacterium]|nr:Gfo/Idh/MocA family oxidoreductase [Pirellulales bacterium]